MIKNMNIKRLYGTVGRGLRRLLSLKAELYLFSLKRSQKASFKYLQSSFPPIYNKLEMLNVSDFVTPLWQGYNEELKRIFLPHPSFQFFRNKTIRSTMFVNAGGWWLTEEIAFLEKMLKPETLRRLLEEDYVGVPTICNSKYLTSHNSIHHLYHLVRFQNSTAVKINKYNSIVEWGGGYGNMAKIVKRMNMEMTYTIIDTPLFSCIQWLYLSSILGDGDVNIIEDSKDNTMEKKINILPLDFIAESKKIKTDIFVATWSLSESSKFAQNHVNFVSYFGAEHLLIAFQESTHHLPDASRIGDIVMKRGAKVEAIDFLPRHYYAFL